MKIIYLLLLLAFVQQNGASDKKDKGNRTLNVLKKGALLLALLNGVTPLTNDGNYLEPSNEKLMNLDASDIFTGTICPKLPQQNAVELMHYVICHQGQEPGFEKYLVYVDKCENVQSLFEKALKLGKCALNAPKVILQGVKSRMLGTEPASNLEMLKAHVETLDVEPKVEKRAYERLFDYASEYISPPLLHLQNGKLEISDYGFAQIENIDNLNFFNVKQAMEFFRKYKNLTNEKAFAEALKSQQNLMSSRAFDEVESTIKCAKKMWPDNDSKAAEEALTRRQLSLEIKQAARHLDVFRKSKQLFQELTPEKAMEQAIVLSLNRKVPLKSDYQYLKLDKTLSMMKCGEQMWKESDTIVAKEGLKRANDVLDWLYMDPELTLIGWDEKQIYNPAAKTILKNKFEHFDAEEFLNIFNKILNGVEKKGVHKLISNLFKNEHLVYKTALKYSEKLKRISFEDLSRAAETSLSSRAPRTTFMEEIKVLYYKEAKKQVLYYKEKMYDL